MFSKLKKKLVITKKKISDNLSILLGKKKIIDTTLFNMIETELLSADMNIHTVTKIVNNLKDNVKNNVGITSQMLYDILYSEMLKIANFVDKPLVICKKNPFVILVVGVNGVGKTTTIGKLAYSFSLEHDNNVMLVAGDTYRAAAADQLEILVKDIDLVSVVKGKSSFDSSAVIFDSMQEAKLKCMDILIIDTAGRLQNKTDLMCELQKNINVIKKIDLEAPHEIILVLDANIGQNSIDQVRIFNNKIKITGIIVTKLDGTSRGGVLLSIADYFKIPIYYIGVGQSIQDLCLFKSDVFIEAIFKRDKGNS